MTVCWESKIKFSYRKKWLNVYLARKIRSGNNCCTENYPYTVAGIFRDIPENSHLRFDAVASFINMKTSSVPMPVGVPTIVICYIRLKPGVVPEQINQKIPLIA